MWWTAFRTAPDDVCKRAMREVFTVGFVSLLPLLLGILIANIAFFKNNPFTIYDSLKIFAGFLLSGQLFFFAMSFASQEGSQISFGIRHLSSSILVTGKLRSKRFTNR